MNDTTTPESGRDGSAGPFANLGQTLHLSAEPPPQASDVGTLLCATRMRVGKDLQDVAAVLHIRYNFLVAIEDGRYEDLPGQAYAIGFVRAYADHLGLDGDEVVRRYKEETAGIKRVTRYEYPIPPPESGIPSGALLLIAVVLGMMVYGVWYTMADADRRAADVIQDVPDRLAALLRDDTATTQEPEQATDQQVADAGMTEEPAPPAEDDQASPDASDAPVAETPAPVTAPTPAPTPAVVATNTTSAPVAAKPEPVVAQQGAVQQAPVAATPVVTPEAAKPESAKPTPAPTPVAAATAPPTTTPVPVATKQVTTAVPVTAPVVTAPPAAPKPDAAKPEPAKPTPAPTQVASAPTPAPAIPKSEAPKPEIAKVTPAPTATVTPALPLPSTVTTAPKPVVTPAPAAPAQTAPVQTAAVPPATPPKTATAKPAATSGKNGNVELRAKSDSWIQVRDGEQLLLTRFLRKGESYKVPDRAGLTLMTLNAGGVEVIVDGSVMPPLGEQGSVARGVSLDAEKLKSQPKPVAAAPAAPPRQQEAPASND